ncbi:aspartic peptidase domain-containing protein [Naematelia encephala]|uniref:Aspartic peptidase domain-containing protein n=1 Tax=Naematelia encephala TaxID=71784 RepID=A0A1Y2BA29_9TREE|nr:aspartic peptidase domain-containing protein [Naematelia encephala]
MVNAQAFLAVFALLPLSLGLVSPPLVPRSPSAPSLNPRTLPPPSIDSRSIPPARHGRLESLETSTWRPRPRASKHRRSLSAPEIGIGGLQLPLHHRSSSALVRRQASTVGNGSITSLATLENTYILPLAIGSPPVSYPLQLDLGSSDLLLASTLCGSACPTSLGPRSNPYYDVTKASTGFMPVNGNQTAWRATFADGTAASGFVAREAVNIAEGQILGQVFGLINSTNLTLSDQQISGILGLGFPRLSLLARALLPDTSSSASSTNSSSASAATPSATSAYLPPLLESLVTLPHLRYPVFALALTAPPINASATTTSSSSASPSPSSRYSDSVGSLTFGGVSSAFVSESGGSGTTIEDIEWHDVVPFGRSLSSNSTSTEVTSSTSATSSSSSASTTSSSTGTRKRQTDPSQLNGVPTSDYDLGGEEYLYWTLNLHNVSVNGTDLGLQPTYSSEGIPSIALLDVGSNGLSGPQQDVARLFAMIEDARQVTEGQWIVPCTTKMTIGFSFGGRYVQLQPSDWMRAQVAGSSFCTAWPIATAATGDGIDWQLGTPFLKKVYSIFSYGINGEQAPLVGFLPVDDTTSTTSSTSNSSSSSSASASASSNGSSTSVDPNSPTPTTISDLSLTVTITTTLPNVLLPDPTFATPSYAYSASASSMQYMGLANSSAYEISQVPIISQQSDTSTTSSVSSSTSRSAAGTGTSGGNVDPGTSSAAALRAVPEMISVLSMGVGVGTVLVGLGSLVSF